MKIFCALPATFFFLTAGVFAQESFLLKNASQHFDVKITVENCGRDACEGPGTVYVMKKRRRTPFQAIEMPNILVELTENRRPTANLSELYGMNNSGVIFGDFNFDGAEDLALRNGSEGGYGGPSYDVWLFSKARGKFIKNKALTELASENLGMFKTDKRRKTIETLTKSGCCWHRATRYKIFGNRLVKIYVFTADATHGDERVRLITERLVNGKWRRKRKTVPLGDYYKER